MLRVVVPTNIDANELSREDNLSPEAFDTANAQCWCGLGSAHGQASTSTSRNTAVHSRVVSTQLEFRSQDDEDEDDEDEAITTIDRGEPIAFLPNTAVTGPLAHGHELRLIISGHRWVASSNMGTFWHEASDLDDNDIASFALLDTLTRWLPHWRGAGTLHVRTNDVGVLRGIQGASYSHSAVWNAVRSLCGQYDVELRAKVVETSRSSSSSGIIFARGNTRDAKCAAGTVRKALRNPEVVNAAVKWLMASGQQGSTGYRTMLRHLTV